MSEAAEGADPQRSAWQPFTFGGVAAFARASLGRLLFAQLLTALCVAGALVYFLHRDYSPVIAEAIQQTPDTGKILAGKLAGFPENIVVGNKFLGLAVTPDPSEEIGQSADLQVQFRRANFRIGTVFQPDWGMEFTYRHFADLALSRSQLEPWWSAWEPVFLAGIAASAIVSLFLLWAIVAVIYTVPARILAWFGDRELDFSQSCRLASAALLPGAWLVIAGILLYAWGMVDLIGLGFIYAAHLLAGWVYLGGGTWKLPVRAAIPVEKPNPFQSGH